MIKLFIVLLGFWMVMPVGSFLTFTKKICVCLALSLFAFNTGSFTLEWWDRQIYLIVAESTVLFVFGVLVALPFLIVHQLVEAVIESLEVIRGVSLSSVLSPLTDQHEVPLVVLISCFLVSFLFIGSSFYYDALMLIYNSASLISYHTLPDLMSVIQTVTKTFTLYPNFFLLIAASMLSSDLCLQFLQKLFPVLMLQDFGFLFRSINAFILLLGVIPTSYLLVDDLLKLASLPGIGQ